VRKGKGGPCMEAAGKILSFDEGMSSEEKPNYFLSSRG
jgi:hypothetical protein